MNTSLKRLLLLTSLLAAAAAVPAFADNEALRADMRGVYQAFTELQPYLFESGAFDDPANREKISGILQRMSGRFQHVGTASQKAANDPGFAATLRITSDMLDDAKNRFAEGLTSYAYWRLRTASNHCLTCHARHGVATDFSGARIDEHKLTPLGRGEYFAATRQFEKACAAYLEAARGTADRSERMSALRKWLVIAVRVKPDAAKASSELAGVLKGADLFTSDRVEAEAWVRSLRTWQGEGKTAGAAPVSTAEKLIRRGLTLSDPLAGRKGSVELLRATALLHEYLESGSSKSLKDRGHGLYLLGLAYGKLPLFFVDELPEVFLELCVRENPATPDAERAFELFEERTLAAYTGSGGLHLPDDQALKLKDLHDLAYGIPRPPERA